MFKKVSIIGLGLIGGSLALSIKKAKLAGKVVGVSRHKKTILLALKNKAIDAGSLNFNIIEASDLVILATPVMTILESSEIIARIIPDDCIVTDVGSTKEEIAKRLQRLFPNYVGTHPLAGSEKRGFAHAQDNIFKDTLCILTPTKKTDRASLEKIKMLWLRLGAKTVSLSPDKHDRILAFISHLPHTTAFALINSVPEQYLKFAATGLKDTTRIAGSDTLLWSDIFLTNRANLVKGIETLQKNLSNMKSAIIRKDKKLLFKLLNNARHKRDTLVHTE